MLGGEPRTITRMPSGHRIGSHMRQTDSTLRPTGIPVMGSMPWGTHVCVFYETKQDLLDTVLPFFKAGLDNNECCVWAVSAPVSVKGAEKAMRRAVRNFDQLVATGKIGNTTGLRMVPARQGI